MRNNAHTSDWFPIISLGTFGLYFSVHVEAFFSAVWVLRLAGEATFVVKELLILSSGIINLSTHVRGNPRNSATTCQVTILSISKSKQEQLNMSYIASKKVKGQAPLASSSMSHREKYKQMTVKEHRLASHLADQQHHNRFEQSNGAKEMPFDCTFHWGSSKGKKGIFLRNHKGYFFCKY
jgi:hypothetical protein